MNLAKNSRHLITFSILPGKLRSTVRTNIRCENVLENTESRQKYCLTSSETSLWRHNTRFQVTKYGSNMEQDVFKNTRHNCGHSYDVNIWEKFDDSSNFYLFWLLTKLSRKGRSLMEWNSHRKSPNNKGDIDC